MYSLRTVQKGMRGTCDPLKILLRIKSGNLVSFEKISGKLKYVERIFCNYLLQYRAKGGKIKEIPMQQSAGWKEEGL